MFTNPFQKVHKQLADVWNENVHNPLGNGFYIYDYEYIDDLEAQWMKDEHKRILDAKPHKRIHTMPDHVLSCMVCRCA